MSVRGVGRGRRLGLTRDRVIEAAVQLIDRDGNEAFSMRRLAAELDVEVMSLYNHVPSKDALLDGIVEAVLAEVDLSTAASGTWDDRIRAQAAAFRDAAHAHPNAFLLVLTRPVQSRAALETVRAGLANVDELELAPDQAVHALRTFTAFITGTILRELGSTLTFGEADPGRVQRRIDEVTMSGGSTLMGAAPYLAVCDHDAEFWYGIELLIAGLANQIARPSAVHHDRRTA